MDTGFPQLDNLIGGLAPSDLVVVGARPGVGKTNLVMSFAQYAAAVEGKKVAIFSLSHNAEYLRSCFWCSRASVDVRRYWSVETSDSEKVRIQEAKDFFSKKDIFIDDTPGISALYLKEQLARLGGADLIVVDYLQLMTSSRSSLNTQNSSTDIAEAVTELKSIAEELNVPIIVTSAMHRLSDGDEDTTPYLSGLIGPQIIADTADVIILLGRPYVTAEMSEEEIRNMDTSYAELIVAKNSRGINGVVSAKYQFAYLRFAPYM